MLTSAALRWLLLAGLGLPIGVVTLSAAGHLLDRMGDPAGGAWALRGALALGLAWALDLVALVLVLAYRAVEAGPAAGELPCGHQLPSEHLADEDRVDEDSSEP